MVAGSADVWTQVCLAVKKSGGPALAALVDRLTPVRVDADAATFEAPSTHVDIAKARSAQLAKVFHDVTGAQVRIEVHARAVSDDVAAQTPGDTAVMKELLEQPLIKQTIEIFDARIVGVAEDDSGPSSADTARMEAEDA